MSASSRAWWPGVAPALLVFAAALVFRLATAEIVNDDFLHLAIAQQIVLGDLPVRDFIDPGEFLFNYVSAAAQVIFGRSVGAEVLLDALFLSLGHALVFVLAARASGSRVLALIVTVGSAILVTRMYSYPKQFLYPLALLVFWRYIDRPTMSTLYTGAACTALAFLFRHDHGANIGAAAALTIVLTHWGEWGALGRRLIRFGAATLLLLLPFFVFLELNGGGLAYWRNMLDTGRAEYQRTVGPYPQFTGAWWSGDNAVAWLYYLTVLLPPATLVVLAARTPSAGVRHEWPLLRTPHKMVVGAALATLTHLFLLRAASESAVADVSALSALLGAWLLRQGFRRVAPAVVTGLVLGATTWFLAHTEGARTTRAVIAEVVDDEPGPLFRRFGEYWRMRAPFEDEGARYVFACTAESDRLLVASAYAPHAYYAAGRGFAAGRQYFLSSQGPSPEFREFSARRLADERVPVVLVNPPDYAAFAAGFEAIHAYLQRHYREAGTVEFDESPITVLVDTRMAPAGTWGARDLPCFR